MHNHKNNSLVFIKRFILEHSTAFSIESLVSEQEGQRRLFYRGKDTGIAVHGERVSLQFEVSRGYLLATDRDSYDGVGNWFYLLSRDLTVLDRVEAPGSFGFIQNVTLANAEKISFTYFGSGEKWALAVLPEPVRSYSKNHLRCRINRYMFSPRYLQLTAMKTH